MKVLGGLRGAQPPTVTGSAALDVWSGRWRDSRSARDGPLGEGSGWEIDQLM